MNEIEGILSRNLSNQVVKIYFSVFTGDTQLQHSVAALFCHDSKQGVTGWANILVQMFFSMVCPKALC